MSNIKVKDGFQIRQDLIEFAPQLYLRMGKIHEACGPAKIRIAILLASTIKGLIVWIRPNWENTILNMDGLSDWFSPKRLLLINADNKNDLFFATEEILRSGLPSLTITELPQIPNNIQMQRLNFSIKKGKVYGGSNATIGLILTPHKGGATNIDSRWYASPLPCWKYSKNTIYPTLKQKWYISRLFSRIGPSKEWSLESVQTNENNQTPKQKLILTPFK
jgi:protein ImuA